MGDACWTTVGVERGRHPGRSALSRAPTAGDRATGAARPLAAWHGTVPRWTGSRPAGPPSGPPVGGSGWCVPRGRLLISCTGSVGLDVTEVPLCEEGVEADGVETVAREREVDRVDDKR